MFNTLGKLVKETVNLVDSTYELTKAAIDTTIDTIVNIPEDFAKGYETGFQSDKSDKPAEDTTPKE